jgi:hypothetical protein
VDGTAVVRGAAIRMGSEGLQSRCTSNRYAVCRGAEVRDYAGRAVRPRIQSVDDVPCAPRSCHWLAWRSRMPEPRQSGSGWIGGERPCACAARRSRCDHHSPSTSNEALSKGDRRGPGHQPSSARRVEGPCAFLAAGFALTPICRLPDFTQRLAIDFSWWPSYTDHTRRG